LDDPAGASARTATAAAGKHDLVFGVDAASALALASRALPTLLGPLTLALLGTRLTPAEQGYYFSASSLVALQSFMELGLSLVVVNFAAHQWAHLRLEPDGRLAGDPRSLSRLAGLARFALRWYGAGGVALVMGLALGGQAFLATGDLPAREWLGPWLALSVVAGAQFFLIPWPAILEGCGQMTAVYRIRILQAVAGNVALWVALLLGAHLWAAPVLGGTTAMVAAALLARRFGAFRRHLFAAPEVAALSWRHEILPLQWRIGLQGLFAYIQFNLFNPVMFHYHGPVVAGQMGMTLAMTAVVGRIGFAWVEANVPRMGVLVARREFASLDALFRRVLAISFALVCAGAGALVGGVWLMARLGLHFRERLLPVGATALLALGVVAIHIPQCRAAYLRAHNREPLLPVGLVAAVLTGASVWLLGSRFGPIGAAAGYLAVVLVWIWPYVAFLYRRAQRTWHV
jgi:hypothetical protein